MQTNAVSFRFIRNSIAATIALFFVAGSVHSQVSNMVDEDAPRMTASQRLQLYRLNQELKAKADAVMKSDARYANYLADFRDLQKQTRSRTFREKAASFERKYEDLQKDMIRKAGIDRRVYNLRLKKIFPQIQLNQAGDIVNPKRQRMAINEPASLDNVNFIPASFAPIAYAQRRDDSFESNDFSVTWSYQDCSQASVQFDGIRSFEVFANTSVSEDDCDDVKGARGTVIDVPAGVTRVRIEITLNKYSLSTSVVTPLLFSYGNSYAAVGIRVRGFILGSPRITNYFRHNHLDTAWSVAGGDYADASETGEVIMRCSFRPLIPGEYRIQAYGRAWATTDGFAASSSSVDVEGLQKIKVTFTR